jgi:hypothetical protein
MLQNVKIPQTVKTYEISANPGMRANAGILRFTMCFYHINVIICAKHANHDFSAKREKHAKHENMRNQRKFHKQ